MNSLEFIDREIKNCKKKLNDWKHREDFTHLIEPLENRIDYLQQIKSELEAWYEVRKDFILEWNNPNDASGYYCKYFGDLEYNKIKKGMD